MTLPDMYMKGRKTIEEGDPTGRVTHLGGCIVPMLAEGCIAWHSFHLEESA